MNSMSTRKAPGNEQRLALPNAGTPWSDEQDGSHDSESPWMMSYLDFLTVLLVLFMFLYAYEKAQRIAPAPAKAATVKTAAKPRLAQAKPVVKPVKMPENRQAVAVAEAPAVPVASPPAPVVTEPAPVVPAVTEATLSPPLPAVPVIETAPLVPEPNPAMMALAKLAGRIAVRQDAQAIQIEIDDAILFAAGSAELTMEGALLLDELWPVLSTHAGAITVEGHTDNRPITTPQFPSNWELSSARAGIVTRHLIDLGLAANRVTPVGRADTLPRADNHSVEGRAQNRRVSIILQRNAGANRDSSY
ncbi:MAG: hypothetical protein EPN21_03770 [Methylococcaceae bacterium]|nr:MAG: hypothetical protein EPN21_03770 [Methylococcaceae bacterium]